MSVRWLSYALLLSLLLSLLAACTSYTSAAAFRPPGGKFETIPSSGKALVDPALVIVTPLDVTDRPYTVLGEITVRASAVTAYHPPPPPTEVDKSLRGEAAKFGAHAVIRVRYAPVSAPWPPWETSGTGLAIKFDR